MYNLLHTVIPDALYEARSKTAKSNIRLTAEDKLEILDTTHRLEWGLDGRRWDTFQDLLTDDFVFDHPFGYFEGIEAFVSLFRDNEAEYLDGLRHQFLHDIVYANADETAAVVSYLLVIKFADREDDNPVPVPSIVGHGLCEHTLRKEDGVWRVARWKVDQLSVPSSVIPDKTTRRFFAATKEERSA